jgi:hypothetical protein
MFAENPALAGRLGKQLNEPGLSLVFCDFTCGIGETNLVVTFHCILFSRTVVNDASFTSMLVFGSPNTTSPKGRVRKYEA